MIEVLKQALEALEDGDYWEKQKAATSLRQAIAELESQKPVAWLLTGNAPLFDGEIIVHMSKPKWIPEWWRAEPLYTHPPQRTEQEPDVVMHWHSHTWTTINPPPKNSGDVNLYYAPPQRTWVGLTDEEIADEFYKFESAGAWYQFTRAIEAKLKEKNCAG